MVVKCNDLAFLIAAHCTVHLVLCPKEISCLLLSCIKSNKKQGCKKNVIERTNQLTKKFIDRKFIPVQKSKNLNDVIFVNNIRKKPNRKMLYENI